MFSSMIKKVRLWFIAQLIKLLVFLYSYELKRRESKDYKDFQQKFILYMGVVNSLSSILTIRISEIEDSNPSEFLALKTLLGKLAKTIQKADKVLNGEIENSITNMLSSSFELSNDNIAEPEVMTSPTIKPEVNIPELPVHRKSKYVSELPSTEGYSVKVS